ncbi:hypothetical protein [Streptomyces pseudovenezuelae]|uniref:hypothetical protein n=1 Tax=Streptomyces pseudovenezuelae TaxID=67350 RepID=UPI0036EA5E20
MNLDQLTQWTSGHTAVAAAVVSVLGIAGAVVAARHLKTAVKQAERRKFSAGTIAAAAAFVICTSVSLNTSFRFTGDPLGLAMTGMPERILSCAAYESLLAMCVLGARERMAGPDRSPGWYGSAVWIFAVLSSVPAWQEGDGFTTGTAVRIIVGSFGSALAAHSMLGLELKHREGDESQAPLAQIARDLRERLMARLGLSNRNRTALEIARERALTKAVDLADEYDRMTQKDREGRKGRRTARNLARWQDRAGIATDEAQAETYRARLAQRRFATAVEIAEEESPWHKATVVEEAQTAREEAEGLRAELQTARAENEELRQQLAEERAAQIRHMEALAERVEAALLAQSGTPLPRQRAEEHADEDEEEADCIDDEASRSGKAAAAHEAARVRAEVRVPHDEDEDDERQDQGDVPQLRALTSYPTKKAAIQALYKARVRPDDERNVNQITDALLEELTAAGITYDRGPAHRAISELHVPAEHGRAEVRQTALAGV